MKIDVSKFERHELAATRQRFVGDTEHRALTIGSKALAGATYKFLDVLPVQGMRLILASGGFPTHFLQSQSDRFAGARIV